MKNIKINEIKKISGGACSCMCILKITETKEKVTFDHPKSFKTEDGNICTNICKNMFKDYYKGYICL